MVRVNSHIHRRRTARNRRKDLAQGRSRIKITVDGPVGQRLGSMGMPGTEIIRERQRV